MSSFLRFVGVVNAAVWLGAGIFFSAFILPGVFSQDMRQVFGEDKAFKFYSGAVAMVLFKRFFVLQYVCGFIALLHLFAEKLYLGRALPRIGTAIVLVAFCLGLAGGAWFQPKMQGLRATMYSGATPELQEKARHTFNVWHGFSELVNVVVLGGLLVHLVRVTKQEDTSRYVNFSKIWG